MKKEYMNWKQFEEGCKKIVKQIKKDKFIPHIILTIPRGGLVLSVRLAHLLDIKNICTNLDELEEFLSDNKFMVNNILLVDDIADKGITLLKTYPNLNVNCKITTLYYKPWSKVKPDFYVFETDKWICFPWELK